MAYKKKPPVEESLEQWHKRMKSFINVTGEGGMSLEEISVVLGCSRERVRQIEAEALRKLRKRLSRLDIKEYRDISVDTHGTSDTFNPNID